MFAKCETFSLHLRAQNQTVFFNLNPDIRLFRRIPRPKIFYSTVVSYHSRQLSGYIMAP